MAAARPLVETTRWALAIRSFAVPMRRTRTIPAPMPIASPALMHGKQQEVEARLGKLDVVQLVIITTTKDSGAKIDEL